MAKESQEDRLGKLLIVMERYFEELKEGERPSPRWTSERPVSKEAKALIAAYEKRKQRLSVPAVDVNELQSMLAKAATEAGETMGKPTDWAFPERASQEISNASY